MKKKFSGIIIVTSLVVGLLIGSLVARVHKTQASSDGCESGNVTHQVNIENNRVSPEFTDGELCDKVKITNLDDVTRGIAFGEHEDHVSYDGVSEKFIKKGQSFTITLNKSGMFHFHDHIHDEVMGYLNVSKQP